MRRLPFLLLLLVAAAPAPAIARPSDRDTVEQLVRGVVAALNNKDRQAVARLTWPDGSYSVTRLPRAEPVEWVRLRWGEIGFPSDISYRATVSELSVDVRGDRATAEARVIGLCYRGDSFTGVRLDSRNQIVAERRGRAWRVLLWSRDVQRVGDGPC